MFDAKRVFGGIKLHSEDGLLSVSKPELDSFEITPVSFIGEHVSDSVSHLDHGGFGLQREHADGVTLNGQEHEFYSLPKQPTQTTALATIKTFPGMTAFATGCGAEICIRILGSPKDHGYFTDDPAEAIATARHMAGIAAHVPHFLNPKS